jgi:preprotein translocase subunit SecG
MILADTLSISINLLLVAHVVISLLLIVIVLMQRPKQEGLGAAFGGGMTDQMFGAQTTNVLQKGTVYLGGGFLILSLVLAILIGNKNYTAKMNEPKDETVQEAPAVPETPELPGSIQDDLDPAGGAAPTGTGSDPATDPEEPATGGDAPGDDAAGDDAAGDDAAGDDAAGDDAAGDDAAGGDASTGAATPGDDASEDKPE